MYQHPGQPLKGVDWMKIYTHFWGPLGSMHSYLSKPGSPKVTIGDLLALSEFLKTQDDDPPIYQWIAFSTHKVGSIDNYSPVECV